MYNYIENILSEDRKMQETIDTTTTIRNFTTFVAQCATNKLFPTSFSVN